MSPVLNHFTVFTWWNSLTGLLSDKETEASEKNNLLLQITTRIQSQDSQLQTPAPSLGPALLAALPPLSPLGPI